MVSLYVCLHVLLQDTFDGEEFQGNIELSGSIDKEAQPPGKAAVTPATAITLV